MHCKCHRNLEEGRTWTSRESRKEGFSRTRKTGKNLDESRRCPGLRKAFRKTLVSQYIKLVF